MNCITLQNSMLKSVEIAFPARFLSGSFGLIDSRPQRPRRVWFLFCLVNVWLIGTLPAQQAAPAEPSRAPATGAAEGMVTKDQFIRQLSLPVHLPAAAPMNGLRTRGISVVPMVTATAPPEVSVTILFESGASEITDDASLAQVREIGQALSSPELSRSLFEIEGHTDDVGEAEANLTLSQRRADTIARLLRDGYGVTPARLRAIGKGETTPVASNATEAGRARNRRVVFRRME
jgi:outer membrane protein OmpA-like peptidoglycan-associated protein